MIYVSRNLGGLNIGTPKQKGSGHGALYSVPITKQWALREPPRWQLNYYTINQQGAASTALSVQIFHC